MFARLGTLLVALAVFLTGISSCAGTGNCSVIRQATHDCCEGKTAPATPDDCCAQKTDHPDRGLGTQTSLNLSALPVSTVFWETSFATARLATAALHEAACPPRPPRTLVSQQTSLLL